jgi:hypothetical protein
MRWSNVLSPPLLLVFLGKSVYNICTRNSIALKLPTITTAKRKSGSLARETGKQWSSSKLIIFNGTAKFCVDMLFPG